jgi:thiamine kinase-like enzyme
MNPFLDANISANPDRQDFLVYFELAANALRKQVEKWGPEWETIASKLKNFGKKMISKSIDLYKRNDLSFNVFNHNDLWINNFMYKYENSIVKDVLLLDYQLSYWGSPAIDINYFLYSSVKDDVREKNFDKLIRVSSDIRIGKRMRSENISFKILGVL